MSTDSLVADALWRSGEPTGGTSDYQTQILQYLNDVQNLLVMGGSLGAKDIAASAGLYAPLVQIPTTDWLWLRKQPRGVFNTTPAVQATGNGAAAGTVTVTQGSTAIVFSVAPQPVAGGPTPSVAGWRLQLVQAAAGVSNIPTTVPRILTHNPGDVNATLDAPWPQQTQTVSAWQVFQLEYPLATDFVRFTGAPIVHATGQGLNPAELDVTIGQGPMEDLWPLPQIDQGAPSAGALIATQLLQLNRWDTQAYRIEYPYIFQPPALAVGASQIPVVPPQYLAMLSVGAAMVVAQDKNDTARVDRLSSEFREWILRMTQEFRKHLAVASELYGRFAFRGRRQADGRLVRTSSGQIIY